MRTITPTVEIPLYELQLDDGSMVRFHDYTREDGGLRIRWHKLRRAFSFSDSRTSRRGTTPSGKTEEIRDAMVPYIDVEGRIVSPIRIGTIVYKRTYEIERVSYGLFNRLTKNHFRAEGPIEVEWQPETFVRSE